MRRRKGKEERRQRGEERRQRGEERSGALRRTYNDFLWVRPASFHSSTSSGASTEVIFDASRNGSEMMEMQNSLVSLML